MIVTLYVIFGEHFMGVFFDPFLSLGPLVRTEKKATGNPFEAGNKIIWACPVSS